MGVRQYSLDGELVKQAVDGAKMGVWQFDISTRTFVWNDSYYEIMGIEKDRHLNFDTISDYIHADDTAYVREALVKSLESKTQYSIQFRITRPNDNRMIWIQSTGDVVINETGTPETMVGTAFDITHIKEAELKAASADRAKSEFLANMSHEIRTPMNGIMGVCDLLAQRDMDASDRELLDIIQRSSNALLTIINDILDFSKIESGQMELNPEAFNLKDSIEDVMALLAHARKTNELDILVRYQPDLPRSFIADGGRIRQIITNIVGNALKFTESGHVLVDVGGETQGQTAQLNIKISDTGIGIPPEQLDSIFDKFKQADGTATRKFGGTGLGLSIAKSFIELMGGTISVESEIDVGSVFNISLNLPISDVEISPAGQLPSQENLNILVIDDNEINRSILKEMLSYWTWNCAAASSAKIGLSILRKAQENNVTIDAIILDYQMPEYDGKDFLKAMRSVPEYHDIPVIVLSSVDSADLAAKMRGLGAHSFMTKPPRSSAIFNTINDAVINSKIDEQIEIENTKPRPEQAAEQTYQNESYSADLTRKVDILIAEDNEINQMFVKHMMNGFEWSFEIAENGKLAVETWKDLKPQLIFMDISMPEMNGYEATQAIRDVEKAKGLPRTPIIALTAHAMRGDREKCLEAGMDDYMSKPLSVKKMKACLNDWLGEGRDKKSA